MTADKLILEVTGASGYVAGHVIQQLLDRGYRVRGTARGGKIDFLRGFWKASPHFEAVQIDDVASSDFTHALEGVDAVLHIALPFSGQMDPASRIKNTIDGTLNVLRQGAAKGIKKFVLTSSWVTVLDPSMEELYQGVTFTEKSWGKASYDDLPTTGASFIEVYTTAKILDEKAAWKFGEEHPELDIATSTSPIYTADSNLLTDTLPCAICPTVSPPFIYGPPLLPLSKSALGSVGSIYNLISGEPGRPLPSQLFPFHIDVRDLALAHIRALELAPLPAEADRQKKRFLVVSPDVVTWDIAVKYLHDTRPALRNRLPTLDKAPALPGPLSRNDTTHTQEVLGLTEFIGWRKTFDDTVDALLEAEKTWA
uniref:UDP-xylose synthase n=1 Tax=Ganoderma boninense TaxID=34458 RepID=A0A5K1JSX2_9APHY|nr:UDP-xylose synthase [Ganoderma boninense]